MGIRSEAFSERLKNLVESSGDNNKKFAQAVGISENAATNYLTKGRIPEPEILVRISVYYKKSIDWLLQDLFSSEHSLSNKDFINYRENVTEIEHTGIIRRFQNKELALELNRNAVALEAMAPEQLEEINDMILLKLTRLRRAADPSPTAGRPRKRSVGNGD